jgi:hypothetical protein
VKWTGASSSNAVSFANTALTVTATNHTGSLVVGYGSNPEVFWYRPWRYQNSSLTWLDTGNTSDCYAEDVSDDGTRIAGACRGAATVWIGGVMTDLETYLEDNDVGFGSMLGTANVITPDGKLTSGATNGRLWIVRLP